MRHRMCRRAGAPAVRLLPGRRLRDHLSGHLTDPGKLPQRPIPNPAGQFASTQPGDHLSGPPERPDPVRGRTGSLKLEGDLPQRPPRIHTSQPTDHDHRPTADRSFGNRI